MSEHRASTWFDDCRASRLENFKGIVNSKMRKMEYYAEDKDGNKYIKMQTFNITFNCTAVKSWILPVRSIFHSFISCNSPTNLPPTASICIQKVCDHDTGGFAVDVYLCDMMNMKFCLPTLSNVQFYCGHSSHEQTNKCLHFNLKPFQSIWNLI